MSDQPQPTPPPQTVVNVNMTNTNQATAAASASATAPQAWIPPAARKHSGKSILLGYLYFALTGWLGWHRVYLGKPRAVWLCVFWALVTAALFATEPLLWLGPVALLFLDSVEIPRWVRRLDSDGKRAAAVSTTVRRPPLLRGLGWRSAQATPRDDPIPPTASAPFIVQSPADTPVHAPETDSAPGSAPDERAAQPQDLRTLLLHEAQRGDGKLTVTQGVLATGMDWERVEGCLGEMVQAGYVDVDNEPHSGVIVYVFPELIGRPQPRGGDDE